MSQKIIPLCRRAILRRLTGYLSVLAALLFTIVAQHASAQAACNVIYTISPQNTSQFGAALTIQNTGTTAWASWTLTWSFANGQTVSQLWNGIETQSGAAVTVKNESYNGSITAGSSYTGVGFNGTWNGTTNAVPISFAVNGVTCGAATGSFTLKPSASTLSIAQGASGTDTITVTDVSPFAGSVTLAASGLPSGVTATFGTNPTTGSSVVTFAASSSATVGTSTVTITGTSGSLTAATTVALTVTSSATGSFTLKPSASTLSIAQGASGTDTITVTDASPFAGSVTLAASGLPTGVTASFATNPTTSTSVLTLTASSTATAGAATVTITGTSGTLSATTTIALTVTTAGSFTLKPSASTLSIAEGASGTDTITVTDVSPFTGSVTLAASGLPTGVTASFATNPATATSVLTLTASSTATVSTATVTITGTSGTLSATTTIALTVTGVPNFTVKPSAASLSLAPSSSATDTITATALNGFTGSITCAISGLPSGVTGSFGTSPFTTSSVLTLTSSSTAAIGAYTLTITCTSGSLSETTTIALTIASAASFTITPSAASLSIATGSTGTDTITVTPIGGFAGSVTLAASGLPTGVTAAFDTNPTTGTSVITFTVAATATAGTSSVTITGTSGALTATTHISLAVTSTAGSYSLWASAATLSTAQGTSVSDTINVLDANGFTGAVTLAISGLPTGVTASLDANPTTGTSGIIFVVASTAAAGASTITITGTSGTLTASTTIALTVTAASGSSSFVLTPSVPTLSIAAGSSGPATINITDKGTFTGSVTLAATGLPTGVTASWSTNPATASSVLTLTAASTVAAGTSTITVTGTSGTATASTTFALTITPATGMACNIGYNVGNQSTSGSAGSFGATLTINNTGTVAWTSWTLTWTWANGQTFQSLWGGTETQTGANVTITSLSYDGAIAAGGNTGQVGFNANWNGITNAQPTNFAINGTTCSAAGGSGFTLEAAESPLTLNQGSTSSDSITIADFGGFTGSVTLAASNLPPGVTAAFSTNPATGSSVVTFTAAVSIPAALTSVTITGTSGTTTASTVIGLNVGGYSTVAVNTTTKGIAVSNGILGMDMAAWYDIVQNGNVIVDSFQTAGIKSVRWPGGSWSDVYHWQTNTNCQNAPYGGGTPDTNDTFANFVNGIVLPAGLDVALTADYGTNPTCNGGGLPSEAAAWVANALSLGVTVSHMTVGNEVYGATWEEDLHSPANNPATYAASMIGSSGFYNAIKAASPNTLVGVVVDLDNTAGGWDNTVLTNAKGFYDFVEYHYYPEAPGQENDTTLINQDAQQLTTNINAIRAELAEWGTPNTPIYVGEIGGPYGTPGKQSMSITQALYAGQVLGELMNDGVTRMTWWIAYGGCADASYSGNYSSSLYGWQDFGGYMVFSDGLTDYYQCTAETLAPGILLPTARAFQLFSNVAVNGENVLGATVSGDTSDVVAYAATHSGGTALVLFNRNETASQPVVVTLSGQTTATSATVETYDKALYDLSGSPTGTIPDPVGTDTWAGPTTTTITSPTLPLSLTLPPWSINVVIIH